MKFLRFSVLLCFLTAIIFLLFLIRKESVAKGDLLRITMCDVGQGDAFLISRRQTQILIDGGRGEKVLSCLWSELPFLDKTIELVIATHPDQDHIGGLPLVFEQFSVESLLLPPVTRETADFAALSDSASSEKELIGRITAAKTGQKIIIDNEISLTILAPMVVFQEKLAQNAANAETILSAANGFIPVDDGQSNRWSIVLLLQFRQFKMLFTADADSELELALLQAGVLSDVDILKVGHHGSKSSSSMALLDKVRPEIALVSCGENNSFGHPNQGVLDSFSQIGTRVFRTDLSGTIEILGDGEQFWLKN